MKIEDLLKYKKEQFREDIDEERCWWNAMSKGEKVEIEDRTVYQILFLLDLFCGDLDKPHREDFKGYEGIYSGNYIYPLLLEAYKTLKEKVNY